MASNAPTWRELWARFREIDWTLKLRIWWRGKARRIRQRRIAKRKAAQAAAAYEYAPGAPIQVADYTDYNSWPVGFGDEPNYVARARTELQLQNLAKLYTGGASQVYSGRQQYYLSSSGKMVAARKPLARTEQPHTLAGE